MSDYFIFKGVSSADLGLMINKTVTPPASVTQYEIQSVPGRETPFWTELKSRPQIEISVETTIVQPECIRDIYTALQGRGKLIFSNETDKYYIGSIGQLVPQHIAVYMKTLPLTFTCEPFAYAVGNEPVIISGSGGAVANNGGCPSEPVIIIEGNGYIELSVNGEIWKLADVDSSITIDTPRQIVYKDNTVCLNKVSRNDSNVYLPMLNVGINSISATGNVNKIMITKNERWL